ncbi:putative pyrroloquinoline-quinone binding quinoprotein [Cellulomonas sp. PhB150]|nr:putative pyrroloquinoline-quinone binding quinoprotein [Cellulomonas sp. PhB150]
MVLLDDDEQDDGSRAADDAPRLWAWARRRPLVAVIGGCSALVLVAAFVVVAPRLTAGRERTAVLSAASFEGAVHSLAHPLEERWSVAADSSVVPVLVGDTLVVATDDPAHHLAGIDVVTGERLWDRGPFGSAGSPVQDCVALGGSVACVAGRPGRGSDPPSSVVLLDATAGRVLAAHDVPGRWGEIAAVGRDVVLAGWVPDGLGVVRVDPRTGAVRWAAPPSDRAHPRDTGNITLAASGDVVVASSFPSQLALHATDGTALPLDDADDVVRLRTDGTYVRTRYLSNAGSIAAASRVTDGTGQVVLTTQGEALEPSVDDPASPRTLTVEEVDGAVAVRAYLGRSTEASWLATEPAGSVVLDAGGRVLLEREESLVGLDAATGRRVWQRPVAVEPRGVFSDGSRVAVPVRMPDGSRGIAAFRLDDGDQVWRVTLPDDTRRVVRLGAQLYVLADDRVVALR